MPKPNLLTEQEARVLAIMQFAWMTALLVFIGMIFHLNQGVRGKVAEIPEYIRLLCYAAAGIAAASWMASRFVFQNILVTEIKKHARGELDDAGLKVTLRTAWLVKIALLEGPALLGLVTLVLIVFLPCDLLLAPPYCFLSFAPVVVFYVEMLIHFPTHSRLEFILRDLGYGRE